MGICHDVAISYAISKDVAHENEAFRFGNHLSQDRSTPVPDRGCQGCGASAESPTALKSIRALLQQLDRARVHRPVSFGREFRPW